MISYVHEALQSGCLLEPVENGGEAGGGRIVFRTYVNGICYTLHAEPVAASDLSTRQSQILELVCKGLTTRQIAHELHIKPTTVDTYVRRLFEKMGVNSRVEAVAKALRKRSSRNAFDYI